jgi:hypothetical protein
MACPPISVSASPRQPSRSPLTFTLAARVRGWMAGRDGADADYHRSRAAWNRAVADFERRQAAAIRGGHLLATHWHSVPDPAALRRPTAERLAVTSPPCRP